MQQHISAQVSPLKNKIIKRERRDILEGLLKKQTNGKKGPKNYSERKQNEKHSSLQIHDIFVSQIMPCSAGHMSQINKLKMQYKYRQRYNPEQCALVDRAWAGR